MFQTRIITQSLFCLKVAFIILILVGLSHSLAYSSSRQSIWAELLSKHVRSGKVDYVGFKKDEKRLDQYLELLDETNPQNLSKNESLAFYINAYNAYTIKLILQNFKNNKPVDSIKRIGGFFSSPWRIKFCRIGGKEYTLDNIEHDIIRPVFKDPRVHFAINCASRSCPPLIDEPYSGEKLEDQLRQNTISFLNNDDFNYLEGSTLYVTKIFKWFHEDFNDDVLGFFKQYARRDLLQKLEKHGVNLKIAYLEYDWSLNNQN